MQTAMLKSYDESPYYQGGFFNHYLAEMSRWWACQTAHPIGIYNCKGVFKLDKTLSPIERYLALLKKSLLNELYLENEARIAYLAKHAIGKSLPPIRKAIEDFLQIYDTDLYRGILHGRSDGGWLRLTERNSAGQFAEIPNIRNFVFTSHTMIGRARLDNIHFCLDKILEDNIPGDLIETGVWKGGATVFMRGFLAAHCIDDRQVWVADSFEGLPIPTHQKDQGWDLSKEIYPYLSVSIEDVQRLFERYDLMDEQVKFLKGWFSDTLPNAPIQQLALLRLDGDLYESTMDAFESLYAKVSPGGFVIIDDYHALPQCEQAVTDFRKSRDITDQIIPIDEMSAYWRKK